MRLPTAIVVVVRKAPSLALPQATDCLRRQVGGQTLHPANCNGVLHAHALTLSVAQSLHSQHHCSSLGRRLTSLMTQNHNSKANGGYQHIHGILSLCVLAILSNGQQKPGGYSYKVCTRMGKKGQKTQHVRLCGEVHNFHGPVGIPAHIQINPGDCITALQDHRNKRILAAGMLRERFRQSWCQQPPLLPASLGVSQSLQKLQ